MNQTTYISEYENVSCCAMCDRFHFLALGLMDGTVIIYELNLNFSENISDDEIPDAKISFNLRLITIFCPHKYSLLPESHVLHNVQEVEWSDGGTCLAISWLKGVVVYNVRGVVVFSTLHHQISNHERLSEESSIGLYEDIKESKEDPLTTYYPSCLVQ